jgi:autotransporter-associated beta strand protein
LIRHFRFEAPDSLSDGLASDSSLAITDVEVAVTGSGAATLVTDAAAVFPSGEARSLRLTEVDSANHARLRTNLPVSSYDLSNKSWTASFWFKRATTTTNDMLFYIGNGNGFSGSGHELEVFCPANSNAIRLQYWDAANVRQANLSSAATVLVDQWNHAVVVWTASGGGAGTIALHLNGAPVGTASFTAAYKQDAPLVFGGIQDVAADPRNFDGWMDDVALYSDALAGVEITGLALRPVANQAGQETSGIVNVGVIPLEADLAAGWKFDGNFQDGSGNLVQLTPAGGAATSTQRFKQGTHSLALLASGDHAATASPLALGNEFTISSWIYLPSGANSIRTIAANSGSGFNANGFRFFVNRFNAMDGELVLETGNGTQSTLIVSPAGTVLMDRWQFVSAVVNRATQTATLYRNGQNVASGAVRGDFQNTAIFDIGAMLGGINTLRGNVDDFRLYSRLLTASDLLSIMAPSNAAPTLVPPGSFTMAAGGVSGALAITVDDEESGAAPLILSAVSSNPALLPDNAIVLGGSGTNRTVIVSPVAWLAGSATVTLSVSDGPAVTTATFAVTVTNGGSSAVWTAVGTDPPLSWSSSGNWALSRTPYPGAACTLDFLSGVTTPAGTIVAQQDMASPFVANSLTLGGSGSATFRLQGSAVSLVSNGAGTPAVVLDAAGTMSHIVDVPLEFAATANVSGNGSAGFEFRAPISGNSGITKAGTSVMTLAAANTFSGAVSIQAGAVRAAHANALGSLGSGTTVQGGTALAALELLGNIEVAEPVQLVMQNTAGHTQLRNVSGNNVFTGQLSLNAGGGRWDVASLTGNLTLSGPVVNIAGATDTWRTLHLTGPASGSITGAMTNSASGNSKLNLSVLSGSWTLAGTSKAYTGTTIVSGGTLQMNTSLTSALTVQNGGTLTGNGSTSENLALQTGATITSRLANWNSIPAAISCAQLVVTGATIWTVRLDAAGLTGFSEVARTVPLVAATSGLVNVNPAAIVIQTAGFPGTGAWSVAAAGNALSLVYEPDLYAAWSAGIAWNGRDPAQTADPDLDGLSNLLEYALAGDPLRSGDGAAPVVSQVAGILRLTFQRVADPKLLYEVIGANELTLPGSAWPQVWSSTGAANIAGPVTVNDAVIVPLPSTRFLRLRVVR